MEHLQLSAQCLDCRKFTNGIKIKHKEINMDLSTFSYSHIYWILLMPLIGAGADIANAVWERIAGKVL